MKSVSSLGVLIDSPMEDFVKEVSDKNVGTLNNLILTLEGTYSELEARKEAMLNSDTIPFSEKGEATKGLFSEMLKIEEKVTYLKKRVKDLKPKVFDTCKHK